MWGATDNEVMREGLQVTDSKRRHRPDLTTGIKKTQLLNPSRLMIKWNLSARQHKLHKVFFLPLYVVKILLWI